MKDAQRSIMEPNMKDVREEQTEAFEISGRMLGLMNSKVPRIL